MRKKGQQRAQRRAIVTILVTLALMGPGREVYSADAASAAPPGASSGAPAKAASVAPVKLVDINSASRAELKTLPGIGDAEADRIIAGRPYLSKVHLATQVGIPTGVYQAIRHRIVAVQNKAAQAKLKAMAKAQQAEQQR